MVKKTLEEKIKDVVFWIVVFFIFYLIIGFLLESLWLSKTLKLDALYDLLKEALTITAAFLAPVAAFVLFSDWREQHIEKLSEDYSSKIFNKFSDFLNKFFDYKCKVEDSDLFTNITREIRRTNHELLLKDIHQSIQLIKDLEGRNSETLVFCREANACFKEAISITHELEQIDCLNEQSLDPKTFHIYKKYETDEQFSKDMSQRALYKSVQMTSRYVELYHRKLKMLELSNVLKIQL